MKFIASNDMMFCWVLYFDHFLFLRIKLNVAFIEFLLGSFSHSHCSEKMSQSFFLLWNAFSMTQMWVYSSCHVVHFQTFSKYFCFFWKYKSFYTKAKNKKILIITISALVLNIIQFQRDNISILADSALYFYWLK